MRVRVALIALAVAGCSAPEACLEDPAPRSLESEPAERSTLLATEGQSERTLFVASLTGLPELWPPEGAFGRAYLSLSLTLRYEGEPLVPNETRQMPRVRVTIGSESFDPDLYETGVVETPSFPRGSLTAGVPLFEPCAEDELDCCPFGARECSEAASVSFERLEGEPFPPIVVDWEAGVQAAISDCPYEQRDVALALRAEEEP